METLLRWKLNNEVKDINEALIIVIELYLGAKKKLNIDKKMDSELYDIFSQFPSTEEAQLVLNFSDNKCDLPFVSFNYFEDLNPKHRIKYDKGTIYIYE